MIKRQTWILLVIFLALAGFALYLKYNPKAAAPADTTPAATVGPPEFLFNPTEGVIASLMIEDNQGKAVRVERGANGWILTKPEDAAADAATAEEAASQVAALSITNHLDISPADVGLQSPAYTITVEYGSGKIITTEIGDATPTDSGYYARKEDGSIVVISKYGMDALLKIFTSPPYAETPTPSPTPTETLTETPTPEVVPSATPIVTETP